MPRSKYPGFARVPGSSESRVHLATGEVYSRRQFDKVFGPLFRSGFNSYESREKSIVDRWTREPKSGGKQLGHRLHGVADANKASQYVLDQTKYKANAQFNVHVRVGKDKWLSSKVGYASDINRHIQDLLSRYGIAGLDEPSDDDEPPEDDITSVKEWELVAYEDD